jgi:CRP/FNR family transcriptional regulator, cyclic AMP receptor protein
VTNLPLSLVPTRGSANVFSTHFAARAQRRSFQRGEIIISEQDPTADVYLVLSGLVEVSSLTEHGRLATFREMGAGDMFGELSALDGRTRSANIVALADTTVAILSARQFVDVLATEPDAGLWLARYLADFIRSLTDKALILATMPVANRLQRELLRLAKEHGTTDDQSIILNAPTHAEFAARIGTHREAVTRELRQLCKDGIVYQSSRRLTICSVRKLSNLVKRTAK